jgi:hypothetical protein
MPIGEPGSVTARRRLWAWTATLLVGCGGGSVSTTGLGTIDGSTDASGVEASLRVGLAGAWAFDGDGLDHSGNALALETTGLHFATGPSTTLRSTSRRATSRSASGSTSP